MRFLGNAAASSRDTPAWRVGVEWALRLAVVGVLAWYLGLVLRGGRRSAAETATSAELAARLARWSTVAAPARVHITLDYPPRLAERDWLAALPGVGTVVQWSGTALVPTAAMLEPVADPAGGADLAVAAPRGTKVELRDGLGPLSTVTTDRYGVRVYLPSSPALVEAAVGPVVAQAFLRDSLRLRRLLLLGHTGWEAKFAQAALEERGWKVNALLALSPKGQGNIHQGTVGVIDTATYSAVLAIDTIAARYANQIVRYVHSGGGLVLWGEAARVPAFAALAPGASGAETPSSITAPSESLPRLALALTPLTHLRPDALVLERRRDQPALAARRIGAGRVLEVGYVDSWRWRTAGSGEDAPEAHRTWLARLVAGVAYTGRREMPAPTTDVAPLAALVDQLGPKSVPGPAAPAPARLRPWLFGLLAAALLLEWTSRRLRGTR